MSKTFRTGFLRRPVRALTDVDLTVPEGCIFGLVGPNGAGKTTTIKILLGLLKASSGIAYIDGHRVPSIASRQRVGFLPEAPHFYDHLRPREYLVFVGQLYGLSKRRGKAKADSLLDFVGLSDHVKKPIRKFSKGMIQRLGIAQAIVHDPAIVILDEPQSGLDPMGRKEVKDMIRSLKAKGSTVFFSSHILPDVEDLADEIAIMFRGRVHEMDAVAQLRDPRVLQWQFEVSRVPEELLVSLEARAVRMSVVEERMLLTFDSDIEAGDIAARIISAGGRIHRMISHRESLEDLFVREAKSNREEPS